MIFFFFFFFNDTATTEIYTLSLHDALPIFGAPVEPWTMNEMIHQLNEAYRRIAENRGLGLVDLAVIPREHFVDGIHLSQAGSVWVAERFAAAIEARR